MCSICGCSSERQNYTAIFSYLCDIFTAKFILVCHCDGGFNMLRKFNTKYVKKMFTFVCCVLVWGLVTMLLSSGTALMFRIGNTCCGIQIYCSAQNIQGQVPLSENFYPNSLNFIFAYCFCSPLKLVLLTSFDFKDYLFSL